ncbi:MAG: hypothetical protein E7585_02240 [Ruminococcaceae bacterium]|nr:hypothetical protein [Oscillospiraceae bacterium]
MIKSYRFDATQLDPSRHEALAYLRVKKPDAAIGSLLTAAFLEAKSIADCRCRVGLFDIAFADAIYPSLKENQLKGCDRFLLFCATLGHEIDRRIARYAYSAPVKAAVLDAAAGALTEALCDTLVRTVLEEYSPGKAGKRFSPGYGPLPLEAQQQIFTILQLSRIGVGLNDSLLLSPAKTVTALVGLSGIG